MEGVCSLRLPQRSLVDGLVGFECRHLAASRWTPREGPNSCPTLLLLFVVAVVVVFVVAVVVVFVVAVVFVFVVAVVFVFVVAVVVVVCCCGCSCGCCCCVCCWDQCSWKSWSEMSAKVAGIY